MNSCGVTGSHQVSQVVIMAWKIMKTNLSRKSLRDARKPNYLFNGIFFISPKYLIGLHSIRDRVNNEFEQFSAN